MNIAKRLLFRNRNGGFGTPQFIFQIQSDNTGTSNDDQFTVPTLGTGYDYDGATSNGQTFLNNTGNLTITFTPGIGLYGLTVTRDFPRIHFNSGGDKDKLEEITKWGSNPWTSFENAFRGCTNLTIHPNAGAPDLSLVTSLQNTFQFNSSMNSPTLSSWNTSNVTNMNGTFASCTLFNQDLNSWDTSHVTIMSGMFTACAVFNGNISNWNTGNVENMRSMFSQTAAFNQNIRLVTNFTNFLTNATLSTANYDALLVAWEAQGPQPNLNFHGGNSTFTIGSAADTARTNLKAATGSGGYGWVITDGGGV